MNDTIRVLLVDDHALVRNTLRDHLDSQDGMTVVGSCGDANAAILCAIETKPDIVLMDIDMPGKSAFEAANDIRSRCSITRVVFLSGYVKDHYIDRALAVEAFGYICKSEPPETVVAAIRSVARGIPYFSSDVRERIIVGPRGASIAMKSSSRLSALSRREREVLIHVARGLSKKQVAGSMHVAYDTINRHCARLMKKLDIHDRVGLTLFAIRENLIEP